MKNIWDALGKQELFVQILALLIVIAWLVAIFLHVQIDATLTNVVMLVVGFFYGSSSGSKKKDDVLMEKIPEPPIVKAVP